MNRGTGRNREPNRTGTEPLRTAIRFIPVQATDVLWLDRTPPRPLRQYGAVGLDSDITGEPKESMAKTMSSSRFE